LKKYKNEIEDLTNLYKLDLIPWVIGYSGGKDSTAVVQIVWYMLEQLPEVERHKAVYIISTDTLVENPIVAQWTRSSMDKMQLVANKNKLPVIVKLLTPETADTFWVNVIGRGYPSPRYKFRWCTDRLKIKPANKFVRDQIKENGEVIMLLGMRKSESSSRANIMEKYENIRVRDKLSPSATLPNCLVFAPISEWTTDDVWSFLKDNPNPWGWSNENLYTLYQGATAEYEDHFVMDKTTPVTGASRFGCWICTLVEKDKSMTAMIQNDAEKVWMEPLLDLRNDLDFRGIDSEGNDRHEIDKQRRDFRRMNGNVNVTERGDLVHGPYNKESREHFLRKVLKAQKQIQKTAPESLRNYEIVTLAELKEIRRIWLYDKHEFEDALPKIYQEVLGEIFPHTITEDLVSLNKDDLTILSDICHKNGKNSMHYEMIRDLIDIEQQFNSKLKRNGLAKELEKAIKRSYYADQDDAKDWALKKRNLSKLTEQELKEFDTKVKDIYDI